MTESRTSATPATPTNFDGYLVVFLLDGPGIWKLDRLTADQMDEYTACEGCSSDDRFRAYYRNVSLIEPHDPQLVFCQSCTQEMWDRRMDDREAPDASGARPHMYPPR